MSMDSGAEAEKMSLLDKILLHAMAWPYIFVGVLHFTSKDVFMQIMPPWIPFHEFCVLASGVAEISLGLLALNSGTRKWAGFGLLALLAAVYPANIHMAMNNVQIEGLPQMPEWMLWARLPYQFLFAALVWYVCLRKNAPHNRDTSDE